MTAASVDRAKLYQEVWAEPMITVAKRYEVSSSFLGRVCERLKVPRPPRGYWAQLKVGRADNRPHSRRPLLGMTSNGCETVRHRGRSRCQAPVLKKPRNKIERPARHPLVVGVLEHFERGIVSTTDEKYFKPYKRNIVDVLTSKGCLKRALDVASELYLALEQRGHRVSMAPTDAHYSRMGLSHRDEGKKQSEDDYRYGHGAWRGPARPTLLFIDTVAIGLTVFELSEHVEVRYIGGEEKYARIGCPAERAAAGFRTVGRRSNGS